MQIRTMRFFFLFAQFVFLLVVLAISASVFAQQIGSPGTCPAGAVCRTGNATTATIPAGATTPNTGVAGPNPGDVSDPVQRKIRAVAEQLGLTSEQRTQLGSALKADQEERATLDKALRDARRALADALANGQTFLDAEIENLSSANAKCQESDLKRWAKLYAILTADQQRRLLTMSTPLTMESASHEIARGQ